MKLASIDSQSFFFLKKSIDYVNWGNCFTTLCWFPLCNDPPKWKLHSPPS